jgi:rhamnose utilization protein RhaD (predicted bifunctional aldolase and dehydrogenase)
VAKVGTSIPDRTISLKRLQCVVENNNKDRSGEGTAHTFCELFISKAAIKQRSVAAIRLGQVRKFAAIVGIAGRHCHVTVVM